MASRGTVLVVDDEPAVADGYASNLRKRYTVRTAYSGQDALEQLDEDVDVVLLDRRMPDLTGDEVLDQIRSRELTCRVVMVTAVNPDVDIIEMGFDDYLIKPVPKDELQTAVESALARATYDAQMQEYFSLVSKRTVLQQEKSEHELEARQEFADLSNRINRLEHDLEDSLSQLGDEEAFLLFDR